MSTSSSKNETEKVNLVILAGQDVGTNKTVTKTVLNFARKIIKLTFDKETYITEYKATLEIWEETIIEKQIKALAQSKEVDNIIIVWIQEKLQTEVERILKKNPDLIGFKDKIHIVDQWKNYWKNVHLWLDKSIELSRKSFEISELSQEENTRNDELSQLKKVRKLSNKPTVFLTWDLPFITPEWISEYIKNLENKFNENKLLKMLFYIVHKEDLTAVERKFLEWLYDDIFADWQKKATKEQNIFAITNDTNPEKIQEFFTLRKLRDPINMVKLIILFEKYVPNEFHTALKELIKNKWVRLSVLEEGLNKIFGEGSNKVIGEVAFWLWKREEISMDVDSEEDLKAYRELGKTKKDEKQEDYNVEKKRLGLLNKEPKIYNNKTSKDNNMKKKRLRPLKLKKKLSGRFK